MYELSIEGILGHSVYQLCGSDLRAICRFRVYELFIEGTVRHCVYQLCRLG